LPTQSLMRGNKEREGRQHGNQVDRNGIRGAVRKPEVDGQPQTKAVEPIGNGDGDDLERPEQGTKEKNRPARGEKAPDEPEGKWEGNGKWEKRSHASSPDLQRCGEKHPHPKTDVGDRPPEKRVFESRLARSFHVHLTLELSGHINRQAIDWSA